MIEWKSRDTSWNKENFHARARRVGLILSLLRRHSRLHPNRMKGLLIHYTERQVGVVVRKFASEDAREKVSG